MLSEDSTAIAGNTCNILCFFTLYLFKTNMFLFKLKIKRYLYTLNKPMSINEPDQTLEIIMTKLDPEIMKIFSKEVSSSAEDAAKVCFLCKFSF